MNHYIKFRQIPFSLGLEVEGRKVIQVIRKGAVLPVESRNIFTTIEVNQIAAEIHLVKGESGLVSENQSLIRILFPQILRGIRPQLEICVYADRHGFLEVNIKDLFTGQEKYMLLPEQGNTELIRPVQEKMLCRRLKGKVINLVSSLSRLGSELTDRLSPPLRTEIAEVLYNSRVDILDSSLYNLQASQIYLETLLNELYTLKNKVG